MSITISINLLPFCITLTKYQYGTMSMTVTMSMTLTMSIV